MRVATKPRFVVHFLVILTVCLSLGLPAEDVLEAVYDESEALPYEFMPLFSIAVPPVAAKTAQAPLSSLHLKPDAPSPFPPASVRDTDANRSADARVSSAVVCALLC